MSRVAKSAIFLPEDVDVYIDGQLIKIKGKNGELIRTLNRAVEIQHKNNTLTFKVRDRYPDAWIHAGTSRSLLQSMIIGVTKGFTKKLQLIGVGYRAAVTGNIISLFLGFSHPIIYQLPVNTTAECPSQTEILLKGIDKQLVGQVAANLRSYRPPEHYKGKGIRYADEIVYIKGIKK